MVILCIALRVLSVAALKKRYKMASVEIEIGEELGRFKNIEDWINRAQTVYTKAYQKIQSRDVITLDSASPKRVMLRGLQFNQADKDATFPAVIYAIKGEQP